MYICVFKRCVGEGHFLLRIVIVTKFNSIDFRRVGL